MRVLVTGSRQWRDSETMLLELSKIPLPSTLVHGGANGADSLAGRIFLGLHPDNTVEVYKAKWSDCSELCPPEDTHRRRNSFGDYCPLAGHSRNQKMVDLGADICLAFKDLGSKNSGTQDCINRARRSGINVIEIWNQS